ncbi:MAG: hypothetical protein TREMPRED_005068 [Tremellales sp. Tagirdzhanova-0007]|nr:MAG: hypothetical protein TREMPRED_005068 [Tremellales sp. Tagirdzhanova-0007]
MRLTCVSIRREEMRIELLSIHDEHPTLNYKYQRFEDNYNTLCSMLYRDGGVMTNEVEDVQARTMVSHAFLMERFDELGRFGITPCHCIPSLPWAKLSETLSQIMKMDHPVLDARGIWSALMETFEKVELSSVIHSGMQSDFLPEAQREKIVIAYDELSPSFQPPARAAYYSGIHQALPLLLTALHGTEEALSGFSLEDLKLWAGNGGNERDDPLRYPHPVVGWDAVYEVLRCSLQSYNKLDGILTTPSPNLSVKHFQMAEMQLLSGCYGVHREHTASFKALQKFSFAMELLIYVVLVLVDDRNGRLGGVIFETL